MYNVTIEIRSMKLFQALSIDSTSLMIVSCITGPPPLFFDWKTGTLKQSQLNQPTTIADISSVLSIQRSST